MAYANRWRTGPGARTRTSGEVCAAGGRDSPGGPSSGARRTAPSKGPGSRGPAKLTRPQRREQRDLVVGAQRLVARRVHAVDEDETGGAGLEADGLGDARPPSRSPRVELVVRASLAGPQLEARRRADAMVQPHRS